MDGFYQWGADPRVWRRVVEVDLTRQRDDEYAVETGALGARAIRLDVDNRMSDDLILRLESEIARLTSSRFWGVSWDQRNRKWQARYLDADGKYRCIGRFDNDEVAAYVVNEAIRDAGLEGKRRTNPVDATGALVPRKCTLRKSAAAAARAPALSQKAPAVVALATAARARPLSRLRAGRCAHRGRSVGGAGRTSDGWGSEAHLRRRRSAGPRRCAAARGRSSSCAARRRTRRAARRRRDGRTSDGGRSEAHLRPPRKRTSEIKTTFPSIPS